MAAALSKNFGLTDFVEGGWFEHRAGEIMSRYGRKGWEEAKKQFSLPEEMVGSPILQKYHLHYCCDLSRNHLYLSLQASAAKLPVLTAEQQADFRWCCAQLQQFGVDGILAQDWVHHRSQTSAAELLSLPYPELTESIRPVLVKLCGQPATEPSVCESPEANFLSKISDPAYLLWRSRTTPGRFDETQILMTLGLSPAKLRQEILKSEIFAAALGPVELMAEAGRPFGKTFFYSAEAIDARRRMLSLLDSCAAAESGPA